MGSSQPYMKKIYSFNVGSSLPDFHITRILWRKYDQKVKDV